MDKQSTDVTAAKLTKIKLWYDNDIIKLFFIFNLKVGALGLNRNLSLDSGNWYFLDKNGDIEKTVKLYKIDDFQLNRRLAHLLGIPGVRDTPACAENGIPLGNGNLVVAINLDGDRCERVQYFDFCNNWSNIMPVATLLGSVSISTKSATVTPTIVESNLKSYYTSECRHSLPRALTLALIGLLEDLEQLGASFNKHEA